VNLYSFEFKNGEAPPDYWLVRASDIPGALAAFRARHPGALIVHIWIAVYE
jgi:hypothetical protein